VPFLILLMIFLSRNLILSFWSNNEVHCIQYVQYLKLYHGKNGMHSSGIFGYLAILFD